MCSIFIMQLALSMVSVLETDFFLAHVKLEVDVRKKGILLYGAIDYRSFLPEFSDCSRSDRIVRRWEAKGV